MVEAQNSGKRPINRPRSWKEKERRETKWRKKSSWYKTGGNSSVMFCPYTPNSELANRWREIEAKGAVSRGWRFRVVELGGRKISSVLCRNPWAGPCTNEKCFICTSGGKGPCDRPGCTYEVQCLTCRDRGPDTVPLQEDEDGEKRPGQGTVGKPCKAVYHGESGYSGFTRGLDHQKDVEKKSPKNALWRHCLLYHDGNTADFSMSVASIHKEAYVRKLREGTVIISGEQDILLNSKQEFLQGAVPSTRSQRGFG